MKTINLQQLILILAIILFWIGVISGFYFKWPHWAILVLIGWIISITYPLWKK